MMKFLFAIVLMFFLMLISCSRKSAPDTRFAEETPVQAPPVTTGDEYYEKLYFRTENFVYKPGIRTVIMQRQGQDLSFPVIELGTNDRLELKFDDLQKEVRPYSYTFTHCNADWTPSSLSSTEFLRGFNDDRITDYKFSFNTLQPYTHYSVVIPGRNMSPVLSGNYVIKVFDNYNEEDLVLTWRFVILEPRVAIEAHVRPATVVSERNSRQQVDFTIFHRDYRIDNPYNDVKVTVMQNFRWDNPIQNLKPLFVKNEELLYTYERGNVFDAGNEFRNFDIRSLRFKTERIAEINTDSVGYHVQLYEEESRSSKRFFSDPDINGKFLIKVRESRDDDSEGEYAHVHFRLLYDEPLTEGNVYVAGDLTRWQTTDEAMMTYNWDEGAYETSIFLKQGYYNYQYMFLRDGERNFDVRTFEGSHFEADNDYMILVYHRGLGDRHDRLIGMRILNSLRN